MSDATPLGRSERALHRVAFATRRAQLGIADLEERMFRKELRSTEVGPPVFVTALPRAGTTMLLEVLAGCAEFATHTYRDMPFILCPMVWRSLSRRFRRNVDARERTHGDGIRISPDSPEAFEEVIWSVFWPSHYGARAIAPWPCCEHAEFTEFFARHRRKIVALRARDEPRARRYLSKNNLNIARVPALWKAVPDATVAVPFREPMQQAASLLRQHLRFTELHRQDRFARRYMADLGHFEFGADLRPIDFEDRFSSWDPRDAMTLRFWLEVWLATYRHLLACADDERLLFVDFAELATTRDVDRLAARLGIDDVTGLQRGASGFRPPPVHDVDVSAVSAATHRELREVFAALVGHERTVNARRPERMRR